jgi:hypothetical protein
LKERIVELCKSREGFEGAVDITITTESKGKLFNAMTIEEAGIHHGYPPPPQPLKFRRPSALTSLFALRYFILFCAPLLFFCWIVLQGHSIVEMQRQSWRSCQRAPSYPDEQEFHKPSW